MRKFYMKQFFKRGLSLAMSAILIFQTMIYFPVKAANSAEGSGTVALGSSAIAYSQKLTDNGDGTYTKLDAYPTVESNTYEFSLHRNFSPDIVLEVYLSGDLNKDGSVTGKDTNRLKLGTLRAQSHLYEALDNLQMILGDVNMDGSVTARDDVSLLQLAALRSGSGRYKPLKWTP